MPFNIEIFISDYSTILTRLKVSNEGTFFKRSIYYVFSPPSARSLLICDISEVGCSYNADIKQVKSMKFDVAFVRQIHAFRKK
jgi:hypothetical protein